MDLTIKQSELLFEATEIYHEWYVKHWGISASPAFDLLLELNHQKLMEVYESDNMSEDDITEKLLQIRNNYQLVLDDKIDVL